MFLAVTLGAFVSPEPVFGWDANSFSSTSEAQLFRLTNQARASAGLRALRLDSRLTSIARWRSRDMIKRSYFSHSIPGYGSVFDVMQSKGYCFRLAGENIGWNSYPDDIATRAVQSQFMHSSGHRANILGKAWDAVGIGAYKSATGKKMWTVLFADRCGTTSSTPKATPRPKAASRPKATARPRAAAPRAAATPRATAKPKAAPKPTPAPTPEPVPAPTAAPAPTPSIPVEPDDGAPQLALAAPAPPGGSYRVHDPVGVPAAAPGLFDGLGGAIVTFLFGS
jgi:uncharacterized protein YkwD